MFLLWHHKGSVRRQRRMLNCRTTTPSAVAMQRTIIITMRRIGLPRQFAAFAEERAAIVTRGDHGAGVIDLSRDSSRDLLARSK